MGLLSRYKHLRIWFKSRHFGRSAIDERYALAVACAIGILSALAAIILKLGIGWLGGLRLHLVHQSSPYLVLPLGGFLCGYLAGWILENFSPQAAGGGIPQVKAALAKYPMELSWRVALVKMIGAILILGGGLTLGRRAPTVHIGAALAAQLSNWIPTSPDHRRQMIAAGAAAGLAAGFTTPIAGVLFVIEELMRDVSSLTLETAIVASFTGAVVSMMLQNTPPILAETVNISFSAQEIPIYFILGALAGSLGTLFNRGILFFSRLQRRWQLSLAWRIGSIGLFSGGMIALLPPFFRDNSGLREFLVTGELNGQNTAIAFAVYFLLTMLAYSSGAPGGLLAPALVLGSALGFLVGEVVTQTMGLGTEATYALAGMGAFFTAVVRVPVTAIVIVFELHRNFNIVLPLMLSCAVSFIVAESIFKGSLYEHLLSASGIRLTEETPINDVLAHLTAADVMQAHVEILSGDQTLDEVLKIMSRSHHRGFPVVEDDRLTGIFTQSDLDQLQQRSGTTAIRDLMTPNPISVDPTAPLTDVLFLLNRYQLSRLPVTEGPKLVGIITRTDIIRVEVDQLAGACEIPIRSTPSYVVYQTRSPATGKGRILLPVANADHAPSLLKIALAIASQENYEIECLQVIPVPQHSTPSEVTVDTKKGQKLLRRLERIARREKIPLHTRLVVARSIDGAILETIRERHINLLIMGWTGETPTTGGIFGEVVDHLVHHAPCTMMLVKPGNETSYPFDGDRPTTWVIPTAGGPNAGRAIELLPALLARSTLPDSPELWLCTIYSPGELLPDLSSLEAIAETLANQILQPIIPLPVRSTSVSEAVIHLVESENCSLVLLGASRESLVDRFLHGNIPSTIARSVDCTVILVRGELLEDG
jgi:chloride channel protein, CIC family